MIRKMEKNDLGEFLKMGELFYKSSALERPLDDKIIISIFENIISDNPYIDGFLIYHNDYIAGFATISYAFSTEYGCNIILFEEFIY